MRILITGITGFVGSHLAEYLIMLGHDVFGTTRPRSNLENLEDCKNKITLMDCNILDYLSVSHVIKEVCPEIIFHLAAQSFIPTSWNAPQDTFNTNVIGTLNVLESVKNEKLFNCIIQIAGSSEEYGLVKTDEVPIKETNFLRPMSPYGVSKVAADMLGVQYHHSYGLNTIITRAFNHEGPRRGKQFVISNFIIQALKSNMIRTGNTDSIRDFTDVRDMVEAYWLAVSFGEPGQVYNICSEKGVKIADLIPMIGTILKKKLTPIKEETLSRPSDVPILIGDCSKFRSITKWAATKPIETTVRDMITYWKERV